ncbi:MAG: hypothetical protein LBC70_02760 [Chitinispirillales bacterium]|nr:hypothetical protein [Chitinispirillales bacterium]
MLLIALAVSCLTLGGCAGQKTRSAAPEFNESMIEAAMSGAAVIAEFKGFGDITIAASGQRASGKIDASRRNTGFVSAQVYTSFGSAIATINAADSIGHAVVNRQRFDFAYGDSMEDVPFPCARRFTYGEFINTLTGSMPEVFWELGASPDTLIRSRRRSGVTAVWFSDTLTVRAVIEPRTGQFGTVTFNYDFAGDKFTLRFGRFRNGAPNEILIRESGRNYISVNYEKMVWK